MRPRELSALLDVHLMLLHDDTLTGATKTLDRRAPLQRRVGAVGAAGGAGAPVRRDGGRLPARAQGRPRAGGRAPAARACRATRRADRARHRGRAAARDFAGEDPLVLVANDIAPADMLQFKRSVFTGFVTDVGGTHVAHGHRGAQHGHSGGGRRARGQPPDPPGRLGGHRWRCRHRDRRPVADRAGGVPLPPAPERARARAAGPPAAHAGGHAGRRARSNCWPTSSCPAMPRRRWRRARSAWACSAASSCS